MYCKLNFVNILQKYSPISKNIYYKLQHIFTVYNINSTTAKYCMKPHNLETARLK